MELNPWIWVVVGVVAVLLTALLVIAAIVVVRRLRVSRMVDPAPGTLVVTGGSRPGPHSVYSSYRLYGVVSADGLPPTPVEHRGIARAVKWPFPGRTLPVLVDRRHPARLRIQWGEVTTGGRIAAEQAARLAQSMREQGGGPTDGPGRSTPAGQSTGYDHLGPAITAAIRQSLAGSGLNANQVNVRMTGATGGQGQGESAAAVVTGCWEVSVQPGQIPPPAGAVELALDVTRADGTRYAARTQVVFASPARRTRLAVPGARLPVRVDPVDPQRVTIDHAALDAAGW